MTLEQMETEIASLRETVSAMQKKEEARQTNLRTYRFAAGFIALFYIAASMGCLIAGVLLKVTSLTTIAPPVIVASAVPMILLANVVNVLMAPVFQHVDPDANVPPEVLEALQQGQTIKAIQLYRLKMGTGLKETKEFIEELQRRTGVT